MPKHHIVKAYTGGKAPVVYPRATCPQYILDRSLGGPRSRGGEKKTLRIAGFLDVVHRLVLGLALSNGPNRVGVSHPLT
jgi:hypothetical protein